MKVDVKVDSAKIKARVSELVKGIDDVSSKEMKSIAGDIKKKAQSYCPKDTGALAKSIHYRTQKDGSCKFTVDKEYALVIHEKGGRGGKRQFLKVASEEVLSGASGKIKNKIKKGVK